jgi:hypothetical protein
MTKKNETTIFRNVVGTYVPTKMIETDHGPGRISRTRVKLEEETFKYDVHIDWDRLAEVARKAYGGKSGSSKSGPIVVTAVRPRKTKKK